MIQRQEAQQKIMMDDTSSIEETLKFFDKIRKQNLLSDDLVDEMNLIEEGLLDRIIKPDRKWQSMTSQEIVDAWHWGGTNPVIEGAHFITLYHYFDDKLKQKNHDQYFHEKYSSKESEGSDV